MYKHFSVTTIILLSSLAYFSCEPQSDTSVVEVTIIADQLGNVPVEIVETNMITFAETPKASDSLDTSGRAVMQLSLERPLFAKLSVGDYSSDLFLEPGKSLSVEVTEEEGNYTVNYKGNGALYNQYRKENLQIIRDHLSTVNGSFWQLKPEAFLNWTLSLDSSLQSFHNEFVEQHETDADIEVLMDHIRVLGPLGMRHNYLFVNYANLVNHPDSISSRLMNDKLYELPIDESLLEARMIVYSMVIYSHLEKERFKLYFDEVAGTNEKPIVVRMDSIIRSWDYPKRIKEFMLASNIQYHLLELGPFSEVDELFATLSKEVHYKEYTEAIDSLYSKWKPLADGAIAPDFYGVSLEGQEYSIRDLKGKIVYVDVWATWCKPCIEEFPYSQNLQKQFKDYEEVAFLFVSVDQDQDRWANYLNNNTMAGIQWWSTQKDDQPSLHEQYMINGIPRYLLIDKDGTIITANAPNPSSGEVEKIIMDHLNASI